MATAANKSRTIAVDNVPVGGEVFPTEKAKQSVENLLGTRVEACDSYSADVICQPGYHSLIAAAARAFDYHLPLVLTPDVIWLTIAQGLANHVNNNAETLRPRLVRHQGKARILVRRDDFVRGSPENPWAEVWPEFSAKIRKHLGDQTHELIVSDFSTTGPTERAASEVVLMDCVQSYFSYTFASACGIPSVTLEGTVEDWQKIHDRVGRLEAYDLKWWTDTLRTITAEFVHAAAGRPTAAFWKQLYKSKNMSGGPHVDGWLVRLLPYLKHRECVPRMQGEKVVDYDFKPWATNKRNGLLESPEPNNDPRHIRGIVDSQMPSSASLVPFEWEYHGETLDYQFVAGVLTIGQDPQTKSVRPRAGWAVRPTPVGEPVDPEEEFDP
jgi:hypothetical protein